MKYVNSLKYMNSFPKSNDESEISSKRAVALCERLGRINAGVRYICLPKGSAGHACTVLLESVMVKAGHKVGRVTSVGDYDSRSVVYIDGQIPEISEYNRAVEEIKSAVRFFNEETFLREETAFVLGLLLCKANGCEYVILEGLSDDGYSLDAICAPYDLIVMPTVYCVNNALESIRTLCEAIRRGTREVVSGNQKSEVYNKISNSCAMSGVRLYIPVKAQFEVISESARSLSFNYGGREGYVLRSPSYMLRDCAMTVIESALALRRGGLKLPWSSIIDGIESVTESGSFSLISASPIIVTDSSSCKEEVELMIKTLSEVCGYKNVIETFEKNTYLCVPESASGLVGLIDAFSYLKRENIIVVSSSDSSSIGLDGAVVCQSIKDAAKYAMKVCQKDERLICFGDVEFASEIKSALYSVMSI